MATSDDADTLETNRVIEGDSLQVLTELPANSVHAIVTDPPYGLAFMGRDWDDFEPKEYQEWCENWARRAKRVLKPGGHLLAFSGNRTHHRLFTGVEDAGFEIRDTLTWHYGSGFPKASDVSKTIDKRADADRDIVGQKETNTGITGDNYGQESETGTVDVTEPATDAAKKWDGWKTGLKPATEYVVMARKPFEGATVDCVLEHGTGALNIGECRVEHNGDNLGGGRTSQEWYDKENEHKGYDRPCNHREEWAEQTAEEYKDKVEKAEQEGRYPSNVVFDETQAAVLDAEVGELETGDTVTRSNLIWGNAADGDGMDGEGYEDAGGPSRYFYTSKASKAERTLDGKIDNAHPTVKPQDLMEWLVKLVTREGQVVLDPFAGSGTTLRACKDLNREFVGIERQAEWADVARVRAGLSPEDPSHIRADDGQTGADDFL